MLPVAVGFAAAGGGLAPLCSTQRWSLSTRPLAAPCSANFGSSLAGDFDPEHLGATLLHASKAGEPE